MTNLILIITIATIIVALAALYTVLKNRRKGFLYPTPPKERAMTLPRINHLIAKLKVKSGYEYTIHEQDEQEYPSRRTLVGVFNPFALSIRKLSREQQKRLEAILGRDNEEDDK